MLTEIQSEASEEMLVDLQQAFQRIHPGDNFPKPPGGCVVLILIFIASSLLFFI